MTSPFAILGLTGFGDNKEEEKKALPWTDRIQLRQENQHGYFQVFQLDQGPIESLGWHCWRVKRRRTSHFRVCVIHSSALDPKEGDNVNR